MMHLPSCSGRHPVLDDHWITDRGVIISKGCCGCLRAQVWTVDSNGYAVCKRGGRKWLLHRLVIEAKKWQIVDHINGDRLDNRRENLRIVDRQENARNRRPAPGKTSEYKGVDWFKGRWRASIRLPEYRGSRQIGLYDSEQEAAAAYNREALKHFGEHAHLNAFEAGK